MTSCHSFGDIEPTPGAPMNLLLLLSDPFAQYRNGSTTRVYRDLNDRVVVVTSCDIKTAFLKKLADMPDSVPGLPRVYRYYGCHARDAANPALWGECFEVEELDYPVTGDAMERQARFCALAKHVAGSHFGFDPQHDARIADVLAAGDIDGTGPAFRFIAEFLGEHDAVLDALVPRNIMFTKAGKLCLADPVTFVPPQLQREMAVFPGTVIVPDKAHRSAELIGRGIRNAIYDESDDDDGRGEAAADAVESLLMALAAAGYDLGTPGGREAIATAIDVIGRHL